MGRPAADADSVSRTSLKRSQLNGRFGWYVRVMSLARQLLEAFRACASPASL